MEESYQTYQLFAIRTFIIFKTFNTQVTIKGVESGSKKLNNKVLLNYKYIKIIYNKKLEAKFLDLFSILYLLKNPTYKLELLKQ